MMATMSAVRRLKLGLGFPEEMWTRRYGHIANATPCIGCGGAGMVDMAFVRGPWIPFPPPVQMETCTVCRGEGSRRCDACRRRMADRFHLGRDLFLCKRCDHDERDPHEPCATCGSSGHERRGLGRGATADSCAWCIQCGARACSEKCAEKHEQACPEKDTGPRPEDV